MANFKYKKQRVMTPKEGTKYSTTYYKQTPAEYTRVVEHIERVIVEVTRAAQEAQIDITQPLKGFPRTSHKPNYSLQDIMADMLDQVDHERDIASGLLGRWNRVFEDMPEYQIEMSEESLPNPLFNKLFS